ncbi:MAG: beta-lactamase family protein [Planctomycetes bacterium]|nr:beta-lactamase family protein [Planctomycetota bacterium]
MRLPWLFVTATIPLALFVTASPARATSRHQDREAAIVARIDKTMAEAYASDRPGAALLVAHKDRVLLAKGYGMANLEHAVPVAPDTVFRLASLTKMFTAVAVHLLVAEGKLGLDEDFRKHLPDFPAQSHVVTVAHLLAHTSGIPDYLDRPDSMKWARGEFTVPELIASFQDRKPVFAPGQKLAYSNSNYVLLGAIVEKVSGQSYGDFLRARVFEPLGMKRSWYDGSREIVPGRAAAYEPHRSGEQLDWTRFQNARYYSPSAVYASGGCLATVEDLFAFHRGLAEGRLLDARTVGTMMAPTVLADGKTANGSQGGWQLDRVGGRRAVMKGGALPGTCTWYLTMPDDGITVILLSNRSAGEPRCGQLAIELAGIVAGG